MCNPEQQQPADASRIQGDQGHTLASDQHAIDFDEEEDLGGDDDGDQLISCSSRLIIYIIHQLDNKEILHSNVLVTNMLSILIMVMILVGMMMVTNLLLILNMMILVWIVMMLIIFVIVMLVITKILRMVFDIVSAKALTN